MYAITASGFRAIASAGDLQEGEEAADELPASLLSAIASAEARAQRDQALAACDWTQGGDSPLSSAQRAAWASYRQALRDVPAQAGFPDSINWPVAPMTGASA